MRKQTARRFRPTAAVLVAGFAALLIGCSCANAAVPPSIESESASKITSTDATLEAMINPGDAPDGVYYQFQIASNLGEYVSEIICPPEPPPGSAHPCIGAHSSGALPIGFVAAGSQAKSVSLNLAEVGLALHPGTTYQYRVLVARAIQSEDTTEWESPPVVGAAHAFTTPSTVPPSIESESASKITSTDATLEAMINPGDAPDGVYYQFQIASDPAEYESELACPPEPTLGPFRPCIGFPSLGALPIGFVPASSEPTSVSLDLASVGVTLQSGAIYHFRVLVAKAVLTEDTIEWESPPVVGADQTFSTSPKPSPTINPGPQVGGASQSSAPQFPFLSQPHRHHRRHHRKRNRQALHRGNVGQASLAG